jgi:hypothetical protein
MKYTLLFLFVIALAGSLSLPSCKKKVSDKHCYTCTDIDSVYSNIPALSNPHYKVVEGNHCEFTDWMANTWIRQHTFVDTLYSKNDTLELRFHSSSCEIY